ncbi:hypothetical protein AQUCO_07200042v1 [Aquilegia coerulea]|uniref:F-box domain-containing protein n=1 Tax=Aquilegia coerulea TaxID=218851 RepID=A0A2G5CA21_AQUCA|nr:hypothetical protein AQUCO_07200042v1 [Aquilegia coerulea]
MAEERFPEEVVMEILSWVPVKPLLRFRCVSKSWFRLLTIDSHFIKLHLNRLIKANPKPSIMFLRNHHLPRTHFHHAEDYTECDKAIELNVPFNMEFLPIKYIVSGVCNGLLCLTTFIENYNYLNVYIWNPLTSDHIVIPCPPIPSHFPTDEVSTLFGFGFHQATNEFKVIRFICTSNHTYLAEEFQSHVSVYTLRKGSWRTIEPMSYQISLVNNSVALVNGALHWLAARPGLICWNVLVSFDLEHEVFHEIPLRKDLDNEYFTHYWYHMSVGELDGLLCLFCTLPEEDIQIWVMKEYGVISSWSNLYNICQPKVQCTSFGLKPLGVASSGEIIVREDTWRLLAYQHKLYSLCSHETWLVSRQ